MTEVNDNELDAVLNAGDSNPAETLSPQQKAAITRKENAVKKADSEEASWTPAERKARQGKVHKYKPGERRWVTLQKERGKGGDRPVPVCVNGTQYTVPRGIKIEVPAVVAEALMNAEEDIVEWNSDANMLEHRNAQSYPVSVEMA